MGKRRPRKPRRLTIADQLRRVARESDQTLYRIAKGAGIARPVLYRFMAGERGLTLDTAEKLAAYFGLELKCTDPAKAKGK